MKIPLFTFAVVFITINAQHRNCELTGLCRQCKDRRFSYYRCNLQSDCYVGETCDSGFCCPVIQPVTEHSSEKHALPHPPAPPSTRPPPISPISNKKKKQEKFPTPKPLLAKTFASNDVMLLDYRQKPQADEEEIEQCPDGADWDKRCRIDSDCEKKEVCAEGKCCPSCGTRRRDFLDELSTGEVLGEKIPQCTHDGKLYRSKQCLAGTDRCWCVSSFGRRLYDADGSCEARRRKQDSIASKAVKIRQELLLEGKEMCAVSRSGTCPRVRPVTEKTRIACECDSDCYAKKKCCPTANGLYCTDAVLPDAMTILCGENEQFTSCHSSCQASCDNPFTMPCAAPTCQPGCHCLPGYIRRDGSAKAACVSRSVCAEYDVTTKCSDELRQYQRCGSACPISCQNRNEPRCHERCVSGCFCKIPYILANGDDPLHSKCVLPSECPAFSVNQVARDSMGRPINANSFLPSYPTHPTVIPDSVGERCSDPLKNYISCGTKCPLGCNALTPSVDCTLSCVPGCFCHAPYILVDATDPQSGCVLPQHCPKPSRPTPQTCTDPRKEWTNCGSSMCAPACDNLIGLCSAGQCSPGCICRQPYVLQDAQDPNSRCVLPSECERKCGDLMKEFVSCGSSCPMGCDNPHPKTCAPCISGCFCKNGLVFSNSTDWKNSKCVRLEDCPTDEEVTFSSTEQSTTTEDQITESIEHSTTILEESTTSLEQSTTISTETTPDTELGTSTSDGVTTIPDQSTIQPEQSTLVSEQSTLVPDSAEKTTTTEEETTSSAEETTTETTEVTNRATPTAWNQLLGLKANRTIVNGTIVSLPVTLSDECPATTIDVGGRSCESDTDCPSEQKCCRALIGSLGVNPQRCACPDPHAVWTLCGTLCPEYCGQPSIPLCSSTCSPSCQCAPGYVRSRNDVSAPCVKHAQCAAHDQPPEIKPKSRATMREIITPISARDQPHSEGFKPVELAVARMYSPSARGQFVFSQVSSDQIRIHGTFDGLAPGKHAVVVHQLGDTSGDCTRLGSPFVFVTRAAAPTLGDIEASADGKGEFSRVVDWSIGDVLGRSIAIYSTSTLHWSMKQGSSIACGVIGRTLL